MARRHSQTSTQCHLTQSPWIASSSSASARAPATEEVPIPESEELSRGPRRGCRCQRRLATPDGRLGRLAHRLRHTRGKRGGLLRGEALRAGLFGDETPSGTHCLPSASASASSSTSPAPPASPRAPHPLLRPRPRRTLRASDDKRAGAEAELHDLPQRPGLACTATAIATASASASASATASLAASHAASASASGAHRARRTRTSAPRPRFQPSAQDVLPEGAVRCPAPRAAAARPATRYRLWRGRRGRRRVGLSPPKAHLSRVRLGLRGAEHLELGKVQASGAGRQPAVRRPHLR